MHPPRGWTIEKTTWNNVPDELVDSSWRVFPLASAYKDSIPNKPGIYAICSKPPISNPSLKSNRRNSKTDLFGRLYNAVYTGSTTNLRDRFTTHSGNNPQENISEARKCYAGYLEFWYHPCPTGSLRDWEGHLQSCLGPKANIATVTPTTTISARITGITNITTGEYRSNS
mgnify:CR=1 FL=1